MDEIKQTLATICGCKASEIQIAPGSDTVMARVVIVTDNGRRRDKWIVSADAEGLEAEARAMADRVRAMHGRKGETLDTDRIDGGEDNPTVTEQTTSLLDRIAALEAAIGVGR